MNPDFKLGTEMYRIRKSDQNTITMRAVDAVLELGRELSAEKYPSRMDIAWALAAGEVLETKRHVYRWHLPTVQLRGLSDPNTFWLNREGQ